MKSELEKHRKLLTTAQVARRLATSERTVCYLAELGELNGFKVGRQWRFYEDEIDDYLKRKQGNK